MEVSFEYVSPVLCNSFYKTQILMPGPFPICNCVLPPQFLMWHPPYSCSSHKKKGEKANKDKTRQH